MRIVTVGLAALFAGVLDGRRPGAETLEDEIQDEEAAGLGDRDGYRARRRGDRARSGTCTRRRSQIEGRTLDVPNDPDDPVADDPVDAELPGEGPEDLSGPDDDDPLPE